MGNQRKALDWLINHGAPKALEWFFNQGPQTVLLFVLLFGMYRLTPSLISKIQDGYVYVVNATQDSHSRQIQTIVDEFRADQERDRDLLIRLLDPIGPHKYPTAQTQGGPDEPYGPRYPQ